MPKGVRKSRIIPQAKKHKICELIDLGSKKTEVAAKFKLNESTVRAIYKRYLIEMGTTTAAGSDARQLDKQQLLTAKQEPIGPGSAIEEANRPTIGRDSHYSRKWSWHQTMTLALLMKNNIDRFKGRLETSGVIYAEIAEKMQEIFPGVTSYLIEKKWQNMKTQYINSENRQKLGQTFKPYPPVVQEIMALFCNSLLAKFQTKREVSAATDISDSHRDSLSVEEEADLDDNCKVQSRQRREWTRNEPAYRKMRKCNSSSNRNLLTKSVEHLVEKIDLVSKEMISGNWELKAMLKKMLELSKERNERERALHEVTLEIKREQLKMLCEKREMPKSTYSNVN